MTAKEKADVRGARRDLQLVLCQYAREYRERRLRVIKLRSRKHQMEKSKNAEHAEAYELELRREAPVVHQMLNEIVEMQTMLRRLDELAA